MAGKQALLPQRYVVENGRSARLSRRPCRLRELGGILRYGTIVLAAVLTAGLASAAILPADCAARVDTNTGQSHSFPLLNELHCYEIAGRCQPAAVAKKPMRMAGYK